MTDKRPTDNRAAERKAHAEAHVAAAAHGLCLVLGPLPAAGVLLGAGLALLERSQGRDRAVEYLRTLANEIAVSGPESQPHGHA